MAAPIGIALLVLTGVGPLIAWRKASAAQLRRRFVVAAPRSPRIAAIPLLALTDLSQSYPAAATVIAGVFVTACVVGEFARGTRVRHALGGVSWPGAFVGMVGRNRRRYGGYLVHLGIVVLFIGLAGSKGFATDADIAIAKGERADVAGYTLVNEGSSRSADDHKSTVAVQRRGLPGRRAGRHHASGGHHVQASTRPGPRRSRSTRHPAATSTCSSASSRTTAWRASASSSTPWCCGSGWPAGSS